MGRKRVTVSLSGTAYTVLQWGRVLMNAETRPSHRQAISERIAVEQDGHRAGG